MANGSVKDVETHLAMGERLGLFVLQELKEALKLSDKIGAQARIVAVEAEISMRFVMIRFLTIHDSLATIHLALRRVG
jgi:hypothetical protein